MSILNNIFRILIVGSISSLNILAQPVDFFIELAKENNPGLHALRLEYEAARNWKNQVGDFPDPHFNLGLGVLPIETRLGAQQFKIGISQEIPWKGLLDSRERLAESRAEIKSDLDDIKALDIEFHIRKEYGNLIYLNDQLEVLKARLFIMEIMEELAMSGLKSGKGKMSNVLLVQRAKEGLAADTIILHKSKETSRILINRWASRELSSPIIIELISDEKQLQALLLTQAAGTHPNFKLIDKKILYSKAKAEQTTQESKPKIGIGLDYAWISKRDEVQLDGNGRDILMPRGTIKVPIHKSRYSAIRQEEKINQDALLAWNKDLEEEYNSEIMRAQSQIELAKISIGKAESLKDITRETIELMRTEYATEGARFEELLRLELEMIDYDLIIAKGKYSMLLSHAILSKFD